MMLVIIIVNMGVIIMSYININESMTTILDTADNIFVYIFLVEFLVKILGLGVHSYFKDNWNKFDFALVISSLVMNVTVNLLKSARSLRSAKSLRFFRVARSQRALRLLKFVKKIKFFRILITSLSTLQRLKDTVNKTLMCFTSFKRIFSIMFITFYIYSVIGVEILFVSEEDYNERYISNSEFAAYSNGILGNFQSFSEAYLALFQVLTESGWHYLIFHVEEFKGFWLTSFIILSFHLIISYILRSILLGMIWEVFIIVTSNNKDFDNYLVESESDSEHEDDNSLQSGFIPSIYPMQMNRQETIVSSRNFKVRDIQLNTLYKNMFNSEMTYNDIKSMKRFLKRRTDTDNLDKKSTVPKKHWEKAIKTTVASSIDHDEIIAGLSTLIAEPRHIGTPLNPYRPNKARRYINRPISASKRKSQLKPNRIICNTEIVLCQQFDDGFESDSDFSDTSNEHIEFYSENNVDRLSNASDSFSRPKTRERRLPILGNNISGIGLQESRTFFRKKTLMLRTEEVNDDLESSDDEQLVLDGDYILRTALLKDQDIQALSAKEMRYCLLKCCKVHIGQDEIGKKMVEIYKKPEVREITEEEVNTIVIQFLRDIRKQDNNKKILDLMDNIQHQVEKICPFGSMMRIVYRLDNQNNDVW